MTKEFKSLGAVWDGKNSTVRAANTSDISVATWLADTVSDEDANCGGREAIHAILQDPERRGTLRQYCGQCSVRSSCMFGRAVAQES